MLKAPVAPNQIVLGAEGHPLTPMGEAGTQEGQANLTRVVVVRAKPKGLGLAGQVAMGRAVLGGQVISVAWKTSAQPVSAGGVAAAA
jgi:hypothetical protein